MAKYTDEQIKTGAECCLGTKVCNGCPFYEEDVYCRKVLAQSIFDLINRQEAEIVRLNNEFVKTFSDLPNRVRDAKTSGVASFAKFLVDKSKDGVIHISDLPDYVVEMVGEGE